MTVIQTTTKIIGTVLISVSLLLISSSSSSFAFQLSHTTSPIVRSSISFKSQLNQQYPEQCYSLQQKTSTSCTTLYSSRRVNDDDDDDDDEPLNDELSKLIGKRASMIKKKPQSSASASVSSDSDMMDDIESLYDTKSGMEMFEMPEFKTKRPSKFSGNDEMKDKSRGGDGSKSDNESTTSSSSKSGTSKGSNEFVDFMADYNDENELHIVNRIGFSTKAWGDEDLGFKAGKKLKKKEIKAGKFLAGDLQIAYNKLMEAGITLVDTSETYGISSRKANLSAEHIVGQCLEENIDAQPLISTTMSNPWKGLLKLGTGFRLGQKSILQAIQNSADRLGTTTIDLYQVPGRMFYPGPPNVVVDGLCAAMDQGLINNIGVCNMSAGSLKRFANKLSKRGGYAVMSNQFEFNLINRKALKSGLIATCKALDIIPMAHSPLADGLASGQYTATNPTGGQVSGKQPFDFKTLEKYSTLHIALSKVQTKVKSRLETENKNLMDRRNRYGGPPLNTDINTSQIAINYVVAKGCVPIVPITNPKQADELIGCLGWGLTDEEVEMLDKAADLSDRGL